MPGPYPLPTLSVTVSAAGVSAPSFSDIQASLFASAQAIYGSDIDLDPDSSDGQMISIYALAQHNVNDSVIAAYNNYSPSFATGAALASIVKINNITKHSATSSTAPIRIIGQAGTEIVGGLLTDAANNTWALPSFVAIPFNGEITVTATCQTPGAISAAVGTIGDPNGGGSIVNPVPGWQTASNTTAAILGAPVESDPQLRLRQSQSTSIAAETTREAVLANVAAVPGVGTVTVYMNDTDAVDVNNTPAHSITVVVGGGDAMAIAAAIAFKKGMCGTYGTTQEVVFDSHGVPDTINFFYLGTQQIYVQLTLQPLQGYLVTTGNMIASSIATYINDLGSGGSVYLERLKAPCDLSGTAAVTATGLTQTQLDQLSATYVVRGLLIGTVPTSLLPQDIIVPFYSQPQILPGNVTISLLT